MKLPRVRFKVRGMMVALAVIGLGLGLLNARWSRFLRLAAEYERRADEINKDHFSRYPGACGFYRPAFWQEQMAEKYKSASRRPWLPVEPDSPEPK